MHSVVPLHPLTPGTNDKLCCIDSIFCVATTYIVGGEFVETARFWMLKLHSFSILFLQLRREATSMRTLRVDRNNCLPPVYICGRTERAIITPDLSPPNILQYFLCHCHFICLLCFHCLRFCRVCCTWYHWRTALTAAWPLVIVRAAELGSINTGTTIITSVVVAPFGQKQHGHWSVWELLSTWAGKQLWEKDIAVPILLHPPPSLFVGTIMCTHTHARTVSDLRSRLWRRGLIVLL